jgi:PAS domain S-box-containing protein
MFDSTLTLSRIGIILNIDADMNDILFIPGVDYRYKNFTTLFKDSQATLLRQFLDNVFATSRLQTTEFFNGASFYQLKCVVIQPGQALCIITNNTNSRKAISSLEEHNFKTLVDTYADSVWSFDTNFSLITANRTFLETRRRSNNNEVLRLGDNIFKYASADLHKKWMPIYERALKGEIICFEEQRNNGKRDYFVEIYLTPVINEKNEIIGCMGITRDITERKNTQLEIAGYTSKLEEFAFKTSHDLRRPIANIIGITDVLSKADLSEEERTKAINFISVSVGQLDDIVISMIDLIDSRKKNQD